MKVHRSVTVHVPADRAFRAFTEEIGQWWPASFTFIEKDHQNTVLEPSVGGRLYQTGADGSEHVIGEVRAYEPPSRVLFTWGQPDWEGTTEVEVRFTEEGEGTRVDLEHRGFETVGPKGEESFKEYNGGWVDVLGYYEKHAA